MNYDGKYAELRFILILIKINDCVIIINIIIIIIIQGCNRLPSNDMCVMLVIWYVCYAY